MRANRRVIETTCAICGRGFQMAEEVYQCPSCAGYHHTTCWEATQACPQSNQGSAPSPLTTAPIQPEAASSAEPAIPPESDQSDAAQQSRPARYLAATLAADERRCPSCAEIIKRDALKCRFCGTALDSRLIEPGRASAEAQRPSLHWGLVLLLGAITCGLFTPIWGIRQGVWAKKVDPSNKSSLFYGLYFVAAVIAWVMGVNRETEGLSTLFRIGSIVLFQAGSFSVKSALESATGINLSGAMTFFFGPIYHQYHFNQLNEIGQPDDRHEQTSILKI